MSKSSKIAQAAYNEGIERAGRRVAEASARELAEENARLAAQLASTPPPPPVPPPPPPAAAAPAPALSPLEELKARRFQNEAQKRFAIANFLLNEDANRRLSGQARR